MHRTVSHANEKNHLQNIDMFLRNITSDAQKKTHSNKNPNCELILLYTDLTEITL